MTLESATTVSGIVPRHKRVALCSVAPEKIEEPVNYKVTMQAVPADPEAERVSELEGTAAQVPCVRLFMQPFPALTSAPMSAG